MYQLAQIPREQAFGITGNMIKRYLQKLLAYKSILVNWLALVDYFWVAKVQKRPYFGRIHAASQASPIRLAHLKRLMEVKAGEHDGHPFNILEIGTWARESAIWMAKQMKVLGSLGTVVCIDPWAMYSELNITACPKGTSRRRMKEALKGDAILKLFLHNVKASGCGDVIQYIRGTSQDILPLLRDDHFDIVYIDGDHNYPYVCNDIRHALRLVKDGGVVCGDDLELQIDELPAQVNPDVVRHRHGEVEEYGDVPTHLGVTVAVGDTLGQVTTKDGFWMKKKEDRWESYSQEIQRTPVPSKAK